MDVTQAIHNGQCVFSPRDQVAILAMAESPLAADADVARMIRQAAVRSFYDDLQPEGGTWREVNLADQLRPGIRAPHFLDHKKYSHFLAAAIAEKGLPREQQRAVLIEADRRAIGNQLGFFFDREQADVDGLLRSDFRFPETRMGRSAVILVEAEVAALFPTALRLLSPLQPAYTVGPLDRYGNISGDERAALRLAGFAPVAHPLSGGKLFEWNVGPLAYTLGDEAKLRSLSKHPRALQIVSAAVCLAAKEMLKPEFFNSKSQSSEALNAQSVLDSLTDIEFPGEACWQYNVESYAECIATYYELFYQKPDPASQRLVKADLRRFRDRILELSRAQFAAEGLAQNEIPDFLGVLRLPGD